MTPAVLTFPGFDPVALRLGPVAIHWYGVMYAIAFILGYALLLRRVKRTPYAQVAHPGPWHDETVGDLMVYIILGVIVGGRLGYVLFYQPAHYAADPAAILRVWDGGMSFHGGLIGVVLAFAVFSWRHRRPFLEATDLLLPILPLGLGLGRIGNFINGELWGRPADPNLPWAMIFPAVDQTPRHPSQLYEVLLEGVVLFVLLQIYDRRHPARGAISGAFVFGYGLFRFTAESFREPDNFLGLLQLGLSMGQWLSLPMIVAGAVIWVWAVRRGVHPELTDAAAPAEDAAAA